MTNDWRKKYDSVRDFYEGLAGVKLDGKWGFVDHQGYVIIPPKYDYVELFCGGLAKVLLGDFVGGKWGFVDQQGKEWVPLKYDSVRNFDDGLAGVKLDGKWGFVNGHGKEVVEPKYDE